MSFINALNDPLFRLLLDQDSTSNRKAFAPNFDVHETASAYILEGELPGLSDKSAVNIEFTDSQTVVIAGKVQRSLPSGTATPEQQVEEKKSDEKKPENGEGHVKKPAKKDLSPKVWVSERSVGSFRRVFRFPSPVDTDGVKASLEHGILSMTVPKRKAEKKRISIE
ncbi:HSP20-like chaperone [Tricharina praecox]|uniref:HSP20-like chaperone n=1 Tax=Tricharina praecox TaxID=43433 RepID=UPI00221F1675|nr:HSP20-like chaperone [Tricharina praecox]KAI5848297.1 HSP20-like chaperone [Tricharina praecox]